MRRFGTVSHVVIEDDNCVVGKPIAIQIEVTLYMSIGVKEEEPNSAPIEELIYLCIDRGVGREPLHDMSHMRHSVFAQIRPQIRDDIGRRQRMPEMGAAYFDGNQRSLSGFFYSAGERYRGASEVWAHLNHRSVRGPREVAQKKQRLVVEHRERLDLLEFRPPRVGGVALRQGAEWMAIKQAVLIRRGQFNNGTSGFRFGRIRHRRPLSSARFTISCAATRPSTLPAPDWPETYM